MQRSPITQSMETQLIAEKAESAPAEVDATSATLRDATIMLERCSWTTKRRTYHFLQLRAYNNNHSYRNGTRGVRMRIEDNPAPYNFAVYLRLVCRELERACQSFSGKSPSMLAQKPRNLQEFARQMIAMGLLDQATQ